MSRDDSRAIASGMVTTIASAGLLIGGTQLGAAMITILAIVAGCIMSLAIMDSNERKLRKWREDAPIITLDKDTWEY